MTLRIRVRRRVGTVAFEGLFRALPKVGLVHPRIRRPHRYGIEVVRDVAYGPLPEQRLDVYRLADGAGPRPVLLYVHGGAFKMLSKDSHRMIALKYARAGWLVFNIDYRLAPRHRYPAAIEDACTAYEWVTRQAARFGGDLDRLVIAGESAGGNLVTSLAICTSFVRDEPFARRVYETGVQPRAVVPIYGIFQVSDIERFSRRKTRFPAWLQDRLDEVAELYLPLDAGGPCDLADPVCLLEQGTPPARPLPPFFAPVGTADPLLDDTRRLAAALQAHGVPCEARYYFGEPHAFHVFLWRRSARDCWRKMLTFMNQAVETDRGVRASTA